VIRSGFGMGYLHYFRFGGESTLGYNGPYIVDATIDQPPPFHLSGATQPLCTSLTDSPSTCFRTRQSGYETNFATAQNFSTLAAQARYIPRNFPPGYVESYHLTVQQQLPDNTTVEVAYVGNHGVHIPVLGDFNQASPEPVSCNQGIGCTTLQARRPITNFTNILTAYSSGFLNYNSLATKLEHRYSEGVFLLNSFTRSKAINNASADLEMNGGDSANINIFNPAGDRGVSGYDQTFNNTLTLIGDLPFGHGRRYLSSANGWQQALAGGWEFTAINLVSSGLSINLTYAPNAQYLVSSTSAAYAVRPNLVSTASAVYAHRSNWVKTASSLNGTLNATEVTVPTPSQYFGNAGRNILRGPAFAQLDLAAHKTFPLWSDARNLEFRMEAFNVLNATNFQQPDSSITGGANFGSYTAANAYPARQVQVALRLSF
jgi:hypothetical protein